MGWFQGANWGGSKTQGWMRTVAAVVASTWNPADKGAGVILSSDKLTATGPSTGVDSMTRATNGRSGGKFSFRIKGTGNVTAGLSNLTPNNTAFPGSDANSIAYIIIGSTTGVVRNGSLTAVAAGALGDPIDVLVDLDLRKVWFVVGGTAVFNGGDPNAGTGGYPCPSGTMFPATDAYDNSYAATLDTTTSRYSGFPAWG